MVSRLDCLLNRRPKRILTLAVRRRRRDSCHRCGELGARLVSLETADENDFVIHNLLWIGFLGEAYMGEKRKF